MLNKWRFGDEALEAARGESGKECPKKEEGPFPSLTGSDYVSSHDGAHFSRKGYLNAHDAGKFLWAFFPVNI